jgi:hypothetical protein
MENKPNCDEHTFQGLTLSKVAIMALGEDASLVAPHNSFKKASIDLTQDNKTKEGRRRTGHHTLKSKASISMSL